MNEKDEEIESVGSNPEEILIANETWLEQKLKLKAVLNILTPEQLQLVKMLKKGISVTEIAVRLGISMPAVSQMRKRIQENNLKKIPLLRGARRAGWEEE